MVISSLYRNTKIIGLLNLIYSQSIYFIIILVEQNFQTFSYTSQKIIDLVL